MLGNPTGTAGAIFSLLFGNFEVGGINGGAASVFQWTMQIVYSVITADFRGLAGFDVPAVVKQVNEYALVPIGSALVTLLVLIHILQGCTTMVELKRPETLFKGILRLILANVVVSKSYPLLVLVYNTMTSLVRHFFNMAGFDPVNGFSGLAGTETSLPVNGLGALIAFLLSIIVFVVMLVSCFSVIFTVLGRFFKIYIYAMIAPIPLSMFGYSETSRMGKSFLISFFGVCLEGLVIAAACILFGAYLSSSDTLLVSNGTTILSNALSFFGDNGSKMLSQQIMLLLNMSIFSGIIKGSDRVVRDMIG